MGKDDLDGWAGDLDDLAAGGDDPFLGAVRKCVVASRQLPDPDHETVGRGGHELYRGAGAILTHVSHEDDEVSSMGSGRNDPPILHSHPLARVLVDAHGPPKRLNRHTRPCDAHVVKVPSAGGEPLSHASIL